jgi:DNA-3-methyladenine glycosylase I
MAEWSNGTVSVGADGKVRCAWVTALESDEQLLRYHDEEWGTPSRDEAAVFEALSLGVFQAGLGWLTVLHKRDAFREAFHGFDPVRVAEMSRDDVDGLLQNAAIIRNRAKIEATIHNAAIAATGEQSLVDLALDFAPVDSERPVSGADVGVTSPEAEALSTRLKKHGYTFVGPTSVYAFMQSIGVVNDHILGCFRGDQLDAGSAGSAD